jgi:hypothetical protein
LTGIHEILLHPVHSPAFNEISLWTISFSPPAFVVCRRPRLAETAADR